MLIQLKRFSKPLLFAIIFASVHFLVWAVFNQAKLLKEAPPIVNGFSYSGFQQNQSPFERTFPNTAEIRRDLDILKPLTKCIRTYDALQNTEINAIAEKLGFDVTAGAWINADTIQNQRQVNALISQAGYYQNIKRAIIGNEVLLSVEMYKNLSQFSTKAA